MSGASADAEFDVVLFYKYTRIASTERVIAFLQGLCRPESLGLTGRVLIAPEGVNGTLAGRHYVNEEGMTLVSAVAIEL